MTNYCLKGFKGQVGYLEKATKQSEASQILINVPDFLFANWIHQNYRHYGGFWGPQIKKTQNLVLSLYDDPILVKRSINFVKLLSFWVGSFATPPKQLQIICVRLWGPQIKKIAKTQNLTNFHLGKFFFSMTTRFCRNCYPFFAKIGSS